VIRNLVMLHGPVYALGEWACRYDPRYACPHPGQKPAPNHEHDSGPRAGPPTAINLDTARPSPSRSVHPG
jgi:hypothetical protein